MEQNHGHDRKGTAPGRRHDTGASSTIRPAGAWEAKEQRGIGRDQSAHHISISAPTFVGGANVNCFKWVGFFAITDHDILLELISRRQDSSRRFFKLTQEEEAYANNPDSGSMEGYGTKMIKNHDKKL